MPQRRDLLLACLAMPMLIQSAHAQERWPSRAVTMLEGFPPGGVTDLASRTIAERMGRDLGQTVLVENRPGAATSVALTALSRARPDGYTLGAGTTTLAINQTLQPTLTPRDPANELAPVGMVFRTPFILHLHPSVPVRGIGENHGFIIEHLLQQVAVAFDEDSLFARIQLATNRRGLAMFHAQTMQQCDQSGAGLGVDAVFARDPGTHLAGRAWQCSPPRH